MRSWTDWKDLTKANVENVSRSIKGVYVIRKKRRVMGRSSDIIYIGQAGTGEQGMGQRLRNLLKGLECEDDERSKELHSKSPCIKKYLNDNLQFSWIACKSPDGVEKALLLAFHVSTGKLPVCNKNFRG